ncbi:unnamed protein product, partial [Mesorhabditis spiculigera]
MFAKVLVAVALFQVVAADCDASTQAAIVQCYTPYLQYYGLAPSGGVLPSYMDLAVAIQNKFDQMGQKAAQDMCDHTNSLGTCLNATMYPIDVDCYNHIVLANNMTESYMYMEEQAIHDYECNAGLTVFLAEFYCVRAARQNNQQKLQQCDTDLNNDINNGMNVCKAYDKYISCNSVIYAKACDFNAGVLMCNIYTKAMDSVYNYCDNNGQLTPCPNYRINPKFLLGVGPF